VGNGVFGERLDKVLEFVEKTGVKLGVKAYTLLVRGYVKGGRLGDAEEFVRKMESCEIVVKPDVVRIMICWSILRYISIWLRVNLMVH
jgi:pentatricopeptide repeat protein